MADPFQRSTLFYRNTRLTALIIGLVLVLSLIHI